jgi:hypothetical protein
MAKSKISDHLESAAVVVPITVEHHRAQKKLCGDQMTCFADDQSELGKLVRATASAEIDAHDECLRLLSGGDAVLVGGKK